MFFKLVAGNHTSKGKTYKAGSIIESTVPLNKLFRGKFKQVESLHPSSKIKDISCIVDEGMVDLVWDGENYFSKHYGTDTVNVIIPTYLVSRFSYLIKCVNSILDGSYNRVKITVGVNGNKDLLELVQTLPVEIYYSEENLGWIRMANKLSVINKSDMLIYCADDVEFESDAITNAVKAMKKHFPDGDGLVSIEQRNLSWGLDTAFGMIGKKFIERFPDTPFCIDYEHIGSDHELGDYAKKVGKHFHCMDAGLYHNRLEDEGQKKANEIIQRDLPIWKKRRKCGILWGDSFELVNKEIQMPMNILFSASQLTDLSGGPLSRYTLGKELKNLGHDVSIIAYDSFGEILEKIEEAGITVYTKTTIPRDKKFDIMILGQATAFDFLLDWYPDVPVISLSHSKVYDIDRPLMDERVVHYIFCRDDVLDHWQKKYNIPIEKCSTVRSGIDFERFSKDTTKIGTKSEFILFVGTIGELREQVLHDVAEKANKRGMTVKVVGGVPTNNSKWESNIEFFPPTWNIEKYVQECVETVGVFIGRTTLEGWACNKLGWIYDVDDKGNIKSCDRYLPPENMNLFNIKFIALKEAAVYNQAIMPIQKVENKYELDSVNIIIPTHLQSRLPRLENTISSIVHGTYKNIEITVGVNGNVSLVKKVKQLPVNVYSSPTNVDWIRMANSLIALNESDMVLYCADDVEFEPECIENAVKAMKEYFPDGDGLVSIDARNITPGAGSFFGLIGKKFIDRFPDKMVFCPDYIHGYSDIEIGRFTDLIDKQYHCDAAGLYQHKLKDESQTQATNQIDDDSCVWDKRHKQETLWGNSFELLTDNTKEILHPLLTKEVNDKVTKKIKKLNRKSSDIKPISFAIAVNNDHVLHLSAMTSPIFEQGHSHEILTKRGSISAGIAYNQAIDCAKNNIVVFMHQDVFLPEGWDTKLWNIIEELEKIDPNWGVLGCVGITKKTNCITGHMYCNVVKKIIGESGSFIEASSLDESVLIIRKNSGLRFDSLIPGFTVYGLDLCLEAEDKGLKNYAISNFCIHNTKPYLYPDIFWLGVDYIRNKWNKKLPIRTTWATLYKNTIEMNKERKNREKKALSRKADLIQDLPAFYEGMMPQLGIPISNKVAVSKSLRVLLATGTRFENLTGTHMGYYELAIELKRLGHNVVLASAAFSGIFLEKIQKEEIVHYDIWNIPKELEFDVIHLSQLCETSFLLDQFPHAVAVGGIHSTVYDADKPLKDDRISCFIANRESVASHWSEELDIPLEKFSIVSSALDFDRFTPDDSKVQKNPKFILYAGTMNDLRQKSLCDIALKAKERDMEVYVVGDVLISKKKLPDNIHFFPPTWDIENYVQACTETVGVFLGRTTREGWACNKPGWVYIVDKNGEILSYERILPPENMNIYNIKWTTQKLLSIYNNIINSLGDQ